MKNLMIMLLCLVAFSCSAQKSAAKPSDRYAWYITDGTTADVWAYHESDWLVSNIEYANGEESICFYQDVQLKPVIIRYLLINGEIAEVTTSDDLVTLEIVQYWKYGAK